MIYLEATLLFLGDESQTVHVLGGDAVGRLAEKSAQFAVGVVGVLRVVSGAKVANTHVLCVVSICVTARRNESVCRVVGAGKRTVREHITVEVIAYGVAVEYGQTVVGIILEATLRSIGNVARCIVVECLGRNDGVIAELLDRSRSYSA